jgi:hypothetical protein
MNLLTMACTVAIDSSLIFHFFLRGVPCSGLLFLLSPKFLDPPYILHSCT